MSESFCRQLPARQCVAYLPGASAMAVDYRMLLNRFKDDPEVVWEISRCLCDEVAAAGLAGGVYDLKCFECSLLTGG